MTRAELLDLKSRLAARRSLTLATTQAEIEKLITDYEDAIKQFCNVVDSQAMDDRVHSNIEWQRNWAAKQLAELGVSTPHPEHDDGALEQAEARVQMIKKIICAEGPR